MLSKRLSSRKADPTSHGRVRYRAMRVIDGTEPVLVCIGRIEAREIRR